MKRALTAAVVALAACSLLAAGHAFADDEGLKELKKHAKQHFKNGLALYDEKAYELAINEFMESYRIYPFDQILYNIALCYDHTHQYVEAMKYYMMYIEEASKISAKMMKTISERLDDLSRFIGSLEITVNVIDAEVIVDGVTVGMSPIAGIPVVTGEHEVIVRKAGFHQGSKKVTVISGNLTQVSIVLMKEQVILPTVKDPHRKLHPAIFYTAVSLFGVSTIIAIATGVRAYETDKEIGSMYDDEPWEYLGDRRRSLSVAADVMTAFAVVFGATSVVLYFFTRFKMKREKPQIYPAAVVARGGFAIGWGGTF